MVCDILAGLDGLGHWVLLSARAFRSADLFAGVILLGVTGYVTSVAMSMAGTSAIGVAGGAALVVLALRALNAIGDLANCNG